MILIYIYNILNDLFLNTAEMFVNMLIDVLFIE